MVGVVVEDVVDQDAADHQDVGDLDEEEDAAHREDGHHLLDVVGLLGEVGEDLREVEGKYNDNCAFGGCLGLRSRRAVSALIKLWLELVVAGVSHCVICRRRLVCDHVIESDSARKDKSFVYLPIPFEVWNTHRGAHNRMCR